MKATMKAPQKTKVFSNDYEIDKAKSDIEFWQKTITQLLEHYNAQEAQITDTEINALIQGNMSDSTISRLAEQRAKDAPRSQREACVQSFFDDVNLYKDIFSTVYIYVSPYIHVKNGKAFIKDGAFEEIEDRLTQYLTDEKSIELLNRHNELVAQLNDLTEQINANTGGNINSSHLIRWDTAGSAIRTVPIHYGK